MRLTSCAAGSLSALCTILALAQSPPAPLNIYDGFESPTLSSLWETSRFTPGAVQIQSAIVRAGHGAVEITVHPNDTFEAGKNGNADSERDELLEARKLTSREGIPYEFSWSMYLPPDFPIVPVRLVVAQWKQYCGSDTAPCNDDSPVLAVRYIGGTLSITQDIDHHHNILYQEQRDLRGHWLDLRFEVLFTPQSKGRVKAWLNDKPVVDWTGVTANTQSEESGYARNGYFYFKMGLYRNVMLQPMSVYLDEYRKRQLAPRELPPSAKSTPK
jgi:hypothetical protein